ncbi:bifunctional 5,10-methylenetetrahydrofolate dehydrogenase/5,10-methenyltetrahydrofolate cyclohydrolase [Furfurilactobacillus entadae]|uniref:bifunctional 5,10-methylenetetrahydrofolate dehydrogenase/5,10-methenyltetrahydrofolate cyclohydrolase n=1 Tax=Furfurilactobacillus entadae TaxID=2922307 RepID=UPI0035EAA830
MTATIIDGRQIAKELNEQTAVQTAALTQQGVIPGLAVIMVGDDPASAIYVRNKERRAAKLKFNSVVKRLPETASQAEVIALVERYNQDPEIHGILVQSPMPAQIDEAAVVLAIDPKKDVDGLHPTNLGRLFADIGDHYPVACTPKGIMTMLHHEQVPLAGKQVVMIGRSRLVGKPMMALLNNANATVTLAHRYTDDLASLTQAADVVIVAVGQADLLTAAMVKPGATVIDVGMNRREDGTLTGDAAADVETVAGRLTPVPGGVGPMTIATLMQQTVQLAAWQTGKQVTD